MKKIYMQPTAKTVKLGNQVILAGSNFDVNKGENEYTKGDFGAKGSSLIEDEEVETYGW